jgi:hypothetical protein
LADGVATKDTDGKAYSITKLHSYVNAFFGNVGGSP